MKQLLLICAAVALVGCGKKPAEESVFDQGRPACVELAVLVDRGHRCLPFSADYVGIELETTLEQNVEVSVGPAHALDDHVTITPL